MAEEKAERLARHAVKGTEGERPKGFLDDVPHAHPALTLALKLQQKAAHVGFDWKDAAPILDKIVEEIGELREAMAADDEASIKDEFGDVLFALVNFGRHLGIDAEDALRGTNQKFRRRFHRVEDALRDEGVALGDAGLERMEALWQKAKSDEEPR